MVKAQREEHRAAAHHIWELITVVKAQKGSTGQLLITSAAGKQQKLNAGTQPAFPSGLQPIDRTVPPKVKVGLSTSVYLTQNSLKVTTPPHFFNDSEAC